MLNEVDRGSKFEYACKGTKLENKVKLDLVNLYEEEDMT